MESESSDQPIFDYGALESSPSTGLDATNPVSEVNVVVEAVIGAVNQVPSPEKVNTRDDAIQIPAESQSEVAATELPTEDITVEQLFLDLPEATSNTPYEVILKELTTLSSVKLLEESNSRHFSIETDQAKLKGTPESTGIERWYFYGREGINGKRVLIEYRLRVAKQKLPPRVIKIQLANGDVGQDYSTSIPMDGTLLIGEADLSKQAPGLRIHAGTLRIEGIPETAGDFEYSIAGKQEDEDVQVLVRVTIIPDPKTLWRNLDSNQNVIMIYLFCSQIYYFC
jgi:hypothetical protein